jgi:ferredoxin
MDVLTLEGLASLLATLRTQGYTLIGPTVRDGSVVLDAISSVDDLPRGWRDEHEPGAYELTKRGDGVLFGTVISQHSWKRFLYPPRTCLFSATKSGKGFDVHSPDGASAGPMAFIGVRPCDVHALGLLDRVFKTGPFPDPGYVERREKAFVVAVQCTEPGATCFCASMNTGPRAKSGFDIALTEMVDGGEHLFLAESGSPRGRAVLGSLGGRAVEKDELQRAAGMFEEAGRKFARRMPPGRKNGMAEEHFDHARWDDIAKRCLSCANCTMVCPTCFCSTVEETTDLTGTRAERWRRWDSCFTTDFTRVAGGNIRMSTRTRYRQWITHKLVHWVDQFGEPGCVGCGRCITWCPAHIDITEEAAAFIETTVPSTNTQGG